MLNTYTITFEVIFIQRAIALIGNSNIQLCVLTLLFIGSLHMYMVIYGLTSHLRLYMGLQVLAVGSGIVWIRNEPYYFSG